MSQTPHEPLPPEEREPPKAPPTRGRDQALWVGVFLVVGIIAILSALFILTDAALFRGRYIVTTTVATAGGIRRNDPVQMRGVNIGRVQRFYIHQDKVDIRLELEGEYPVPKDSRVVLRSAGLLGGMVADIAPGRSPERLTNGDHIAGTAEVALQDATERLASQVEAVITRVERLLSDETIEHVGTTTANVDAGSRQMRTVLSQLSSAITDQRRELTALTASLQKSAQGVERVTTGPEIDRALKRLDTLGERMETVSASLDRSTKSMETVMGRVARGEGSLGKAMRDEDLYRNLNQAAVNMSEATKNINALAEEIRRNPSKFLKIEVF